MKRTRLSLPLVEEALELLEYLFLDAQVGYEVIGVLHLFQCLLFVPAEGFGNVNADIDEQIARTAVVPVAVDTGQALATQAEYFTGLGTRFDLDLHLAIDGWDFYRATQRGCWYAKQ